MAPGLIEPDLIGQPAVANLNTSGDSDVCEFADWHTHTQVINGMYKRVFVYDTVPVPAAGGVVSGCPAISYSYIDCNYTVQVAEEKERASYCSGNYQAQGLTFFSDSTGGGLGLSGTFTTSAIGYARRKWVVGTDIESICNQTSNCSLGKIPGVYNPTFDTAATIGSHIAQLLMHCEQSCPTFNQNLVTY
jgi:hypothetical protein